MSKRNSIMPEGPVLWLVQLDFTAPGREAEFNEWYSKTHLQDVVKGPGIVKGVRYEAVRPGPGQRKYLTTYELEGEDIIDTLMLSPEMKLATEDTAKRGYRSCINLSSHTFWRRMASA